ncbi:MAG: hypothetical protein WC444_05860 [Candidatus Paceibacterota bacterium]
MTTTKESLIKEWLKKQLKDKNLPDSLNEDLILDFLPTGNGIKMTLVRKSTMKSESCFLQLTDFKDGKYKPLTDVKDIIRVASYGLDFLLNRLV